MAVRETGGRDPLRGIQIPGVSAGGPQPTSGAPSAGLAVAPSSMDKGKGPASSSSAPGGTGASEEERQHRLHRADGLLVSDPSEASEDCWRGRGGRLLGPGRVEARQSSATSSIRARHHHHHHRHRSRRHHRHVGVISPRGTSSNNNHSSSSKSDGRPASRVARKSRAPSECSPFFH